MNKARKKKYKQGTMKRLVRESLILSSTRFVSSRVVRFFETGTAAPLLNSVKAVDSFVKDKVTNPLFEKIELRKNLTSPMRNHFASFLANNPVFRRLNALCRAVMNTSLRSVGIFLLTFGIYSAAIFLLKRYISSMLGAANPDDLSVAAITAVVGLLLTMFGDKSIISALGSGRITGALLSGALGINDSSFDRAPKSPPETAIGVSFLLGSLLGVFTLFWSPAAVLASLFWFITLVAILNVPEFGLLLAVMAVSFASLEFVAAIAFSTLISYLLKCLRLKRNLRFGTADAVMLLLLFVMFVASLSSGGEINGGELYLLVFVSLYFAAKNLLCSEKLLYQSFNALCGGLSVGMVLYIVGEFASLIPHEHLRGAALTVSGHVLSPEMLAMMVSAALPFAFSSFTSFGTKRRDFVFVVLALACAAVTDSFLFYALLLVSFFVFIAIAFNAPVGALLGAAAVMPSMLLIISDFTSSAAVTAGAGARADSAFLNSSIAFPNLWANLNSFGGVISIAVMAVAIIFILQRIFGCTVINNSPYLTHISGTVAASSTVLLVCSFMFNPFSDIRTVLAVMFVFGLCGSVYKVCSVSQNSFREV